MTSNPKNTNNTLIRLYIACPKQTTFLVETDSSELVYFLNAKYGHYCTQICNEAADIKIVAMKSPKGGTIFTKDGQCKTSNLIHIVNSIIKRSVQYDETVLALHGAAVSFNGEVALFIAPTTSGKTTLTSYLTATGCTYITDDCILIEKETLAIHPYTTPISLRAGGLNILLKKGIILPKTAILNDGYTERFTYTPPIVLTTKEQISKIFFIKRANENNLKKLPPHMSIEQFIHNTAIVYPINEYLLTTFIKMCQLPCYNLTYKNMKFVKEVIQSTNIVNGKESYDDC